MANALTDRDWNTLIGRIREGRCTPFLGAGACYGALPLGGDIAREWARQYDFPMADRDDLIAVSQYIAVLHDRAFPKEEIGRLFRRLHDPRVRPDDLPEPFRGLRPPNFRDPDEPHGVLARLPLRVYLTTNYDDFMFQALKARLRDARREICRWNALVRDLPAVFDDGHAPTPATPVVYHLHGFAEVPESLVLTEDDYLEFLAAMIRESDLLPKPVAASLANSALLFIGYRLADVNFRVLLQTLRPTPNMTSLVVLLPPPGDSPDVRRRAQEYLDRYYGALRLSVYWGTAREFCKELWTRFQAADGSG